jgi:serine/threonine protein kinase
MPDNFSDPLKDLISKVLNKDPTQRITALEIINHPFFATE